MLLKTFKPGHPVTVSITSNMIVRLQDVVIAHVRQKTPEELKRITLRLQEDAEDLDEWEDHYVTLLVLLSTFEEAAASQDAIVDVEIPEPAPEPTPET